jgi:ferritin
MAIISEEMIQLLNLRIEQEEQSCRLYHAMQIWLEFSGYFGAAKLFKKYSEEELKHSEWVYKYLLDLNIRPDVPALVKPQVDFKSLPQIIALGYQHEVDITNQCKVLLRKTQVERDDLTYQLALRFVTEQVEELGKMQCLVDRLTAFGDTAISLRLLDKEMGEL